MKHLSFYFEFRCGPLTLVVGGRPAKGQQPLSASSAADADFFAFADEEVRRSQQSKSLSTVRNYSTALRELRHFVGTDRLPFSQLTPSLMAGLEHHLSHRDLSLNTCSCYMRSLRALYHQAQQAYGLNPDANPFVNIFTGREKTRKRAVEASDICHIRNADLGRSRRMQLVRDIFLFCFYACGMPFVDVAYLRKYQIADGYLCYRRHKTGQRIRIKVLPCMQQIVDRYLTDTSDFVFPILRDVPPDRWNQVYLRQLSYYNEGLCRLSRRAGLDVHLSSYVALHTWASVARESLIDVPVISKGLGHTNVQTTQVYMREINDRRLDEANEKIMNCVFGTSLHKRPCEKVDL